MSGRVIAPRINFTLENVDDGLGQSHADEGKAVAEDRDSEEARFIQLEMKTGGNVCDLE